MLYAGTNYRNEIIELIEDDLLTERQALLEALAHMSMDEAKVLHTSLLEFCGVDTEEEPIIPMGAA